MDKFERIRKLIAGEKTDRTPLSMWMHFHLKDRNPFTLSAGTVDLLERYDLDLVKITPMGLYFVQDFGATIKFGSKEWEHPLMQENLLPSRAALENLPMLDIHTGAIGRELSAVALTAKEISGRAPMLMTLFTPLTILCKMIGNGDIPATLKYFMEECPQQLHAALRKIQRMEEQFVDETIARGADGFFFATQAANFQTLPSTDRYREFGLTYDYPLAQRIRDAGKICLLHVCMREVMLDMFRDFPADIVNWDNLHSGTTITRAREILPDKVLAGGINIFKIMDYTKDQVDEMVENALREAGDRRFMLAPTCVLLASTPEENLREIRTYTNGRA